VIEEEASRTLDEMRTMVRVLRRDDAVELAPAATVTDLQRLVSTGDSGPAVTVRVDDAVGALAAPIASALYRIAQESVTNARRHARHATRVDVLLVATGDRVRLTVHDDGVPGSASAAGYGLTGMAERAALLGGICTAGPDPDGGWIVVADLPRRGGAT
jgi:signal transduction histidine kinase